LRRRDAEFLEELVNRLERELRWYQKELGVSTGAQRDVSAAASAAASGGGGSPPWSTDPELLPPLLVAYDRRIEELEGVARRVETLERAASELRAENRRMRGDVSAALEGGGRGGEGVAGASEGPGGSGLLLEGGADAEELALLRREVDALRQSDEVRKREAAGAGEALRRRTAALESVRSTAREMSAALDTARARVGALEQEARRSQQAAAAAVGRADGVSGRARALEDEVADAREEARAATERARRLEQLVESLSSEAAREGEAAADQTESFRVRGRRRRSRDASLRPLP